MTMKLTHIALAALALAAGTTAFAGTERLAGASASAISVVKGLKNLCGANTFTLFKQSSSLSSTGNIWTATCSANFTGTTDQVRFNNGGGSLTAVSSAALGGNVAVTLLNPAAATCSNLNAGTGVLSFLAAGEIKNCTTTGTVSETTEGGFMDVDGTVFRANGLTIPASVNDATDYVASGFQQAFGVGVSPTLYAALQSYQVATGQLPSTCTGASPTFTVTAPALTTPACQPSLSRAQIAPYMSGASNARTAGVSMLFGGTNLVKTDSTWTNAPAAATPVTYCRRPNTSGTQASAQLYFLNSPTGSGELGGLALVVGSNAVPTPPATSTVVTQVKLVIDTRTGTSDVKTCMNTAAGYAFGVVSLENNPIGGSDTYRLVKINGVSGTEGTSATDSNTVEAIRGNYDFVYNTAIYCPGGTCAPILTAINNAVVAGNGSPGIFLTTEAKFLRGSNKPTRPLVLK